MKGNNQKEEKSLVYKIMQYYSNSAISIKSSNTVTVKDLMEVYQLKSKALPISQDIASSLKSITTDQKRALAKKRKELFDELITEVVSELLVDMEISTELTNTAGADESLVETLKESIKGFNVDFTSDQGISKAIEIEQVRINTLDNGDDYKGLYQESLDSYRALFHDVLDKELKEYLKENIINFLGVIKEDNIESAHFAIDLIEFFSKTKDGIKFDLQFLPEVGEGGAAARYNPNTNRIEMPLSNEGIKFYKEYTGSSSILPTLAHELLHRFSLDSESRGSDIALSDIFCDQISQGAQDEGALLNILGDVVTIFNGPFYYKEAQKLIKEGKEIKGELRRLIEETVPGFVTRCYLKFDKEKVNNTISASFIRYYNQESEIQKTSVQEVLDLSDNLIALYKQHFLQHGIKNITIGLFDKEDVSQTIRLMNPELFNPINLESNRQQEEVKDGDLAKKRRANKSPERYDPDPSSFSSSSSSSEEVSHGSKKIKPNKPSTSPASQDVSALRDAPSVLESASVEQKQDPNKLPSGQSSSQSDRGGR